MDPLFQQKQAVYIITTSRRLAQALGLTGAEYEAQGEA